jgi:hypothetical protein
MIKLFVIVVVGASENATMKSKADLVQKDKSMSKKYISKLSEFAQKEKNQELFELLQLISSSKKIQKSVVYEPEDKNFSFSIDGSDPEEESIFVDINIYDDILCISYSIFGNALASQNIKDILSAYPEVSKSISANADHMDG